MNSRKAENSVRHSPEVILTFNGDIHNFRVKYFHANREQLAPAQPIQEVLPHKYKLNALTTSMFITLCGRY